MRDFLTRISSRKFLTAVAVQVAAIIALLWPRYGEQTNETAIRVAALAAMVLAALGYGRIEAAIDSAAAGTNELP